MDTNIGQNARRKIYLCAPAKSEFKYLDFASQLALLGFEVYPDTVKLMPGTNVKAALEQQVEEADLFLVLSGIDAEWDPEVDRLLAEKAMKGPGWVLPVSENLGFGVNLPLSVQDLKPIYLQIFPNVENGAKQIAETINQLLALRSRSSGTIIGGSGYVAQIQVAGFSAFTVPQTIDFRTAEKAISRWTVVLGENGTGKTTLLRAIAAFSASGPESVRLATQRCTLNASPQLVDGQTYSIQGNSNEFDDLRPFCIGYGAGRMTLPARRSANASGPTATLFADDIDLPDPEDWFLQVDHSLRVRKDAATTRHFTRVKASLIKLLPDVTDIEVGTDGARTQVRVFMHGDWFPMSAMSLGYRTALAWMVDLAQKMFDRYPNSPDPLQENVMV